MAELRKPQGSTAAMWSGGDELPLNELDAAAKSVGQGGNGRLVLILSALILSNSLSMPNNYKNFTPNSQLASSCGLADPGFSL